MVILSAEEDAAVVRTSLVPMRLVQTVVLVPRWLATPELLVVRIGGVKLAEEAVCVLLVLLTLRRLFAHLERLQLSVHQIGIVLESSHLSELAR